MLSKVSRAFVVALMFFALFAAATGPLPTVTTTATVTAPAQQCSTGPIQCCNSIHNAGLLSGLLGVLGIVLPDLNVLLGLGCVSLGSSCSAQTVCCEQTNVHGLIAIGCTPIDIL
ncbi:hypothetical protein ONZ45_g6791 [Pleurotus djamor]|nr:hypothetical protein ONZ45_g6791 [Pleurotus djamor]